jgi:hypothetical protein
MICVICQIDRLVRDFINNDSICYKCVYQKKIEKQSKKRTPKKIFCRICGKEIIHIENLKKNKRTVYCSYDCAEKGHRKKMNDYWCHKVCGYMTIPIN